MSSRYYNFWMLFFKGNMCKVSLLKAPPFSEVFHLFFHSTFVDIANVNDTPSESAIIFNLIISVPTFIKPECVG